jgi:hypothetical protein
MNEIAGTNCLLQTQPFAAYDESGQAKEREYMLSVLSYSSALF